MNIGQFSYLASTLIFCSIPLFVYFLKRSRLRREGIMLSKKEWKAVLWTVVAMVIIAIPGEATFLKWQIYDYNPALTFYVHFLGIEAETYAYMTLVALVVSMATLVYAGREDRKRAS